MKKEFILYAVCIALLVAIVSIGAVVTIKTEPIKLVQTLDSGIDHPGPNDSAITIIR